MSHAHVRVVVRAAIAACGAVEASAARVQAGARTLSVQQLTIRHVAPPVQSSVGGDQGLEVLAWLDRPDSAYARGERVRGCS